MSDPRWKRAALRELTLVRYREFIREPEAIFWGFAFPILLAVCLGIAFRNQPPEILRVAAVTAPIRDALTQDAQLDVVAATADEARAALRAGTVTLVAEPGTDGQVVFHYDDASPEARTARILADRAIQRAAGRIDPVAVRDDVSPEVGSRYIDFLIPGLIGMGIMGSGIWGLGFSIVDARRRKLMKRIVATPMPRHYYLLSYLLWRMTLLWIEVGVPLAFGVCVFGVPLRGSLAQFAVICVLGSLAFSAIGLLMASRARTIEAVSGLMNLVMVPMWILSGIFFSAQRFPEAIQPVIKALPLTALIDALRATMLRGVPITQLGHELAVLSAYLVICFAVALRIFRWR